VLHSLAASLNVLVFPRLNTLPFDGLAPSREIAGRRSSVLRRLAKTKKPLFLVSTAEAIMRAAAVCRRVGGGSACLKVGATHAAQDFQTRLEALGYDLDEEAEYPGTALFHGKTLRISSCGRSWSIQNRAFRWSDPQNRGRRPGKAQCYVRGQGAAH
jgi:transcription-repair coupling factor (superfamily II helicase)